MKKCIQFALNQKFNGPNIRNMSKANTLQYMYIEVYWRSTYNFSMLGIWDKYAQNGIEVHRKKQKILKKNQKLKKNEKSSIF